MLVGLALDVPGQVDYVLTPADVEFLNSMAAQMDAEIQSLAHQNRYAFFRLDVLYAQSKDGLSFSLAAYRGTGTPYGPVISLDGVHPNSAGQTILANAAISAINDAYHVRIAPLTESAQGTEKNSRPVGRLFFSVAIAPDQSVLSAFSIVNRTWRVCAMVSAFALFPASIRWMERRLASATDCDG